EPLQLLGVQPDANGAVEDADRRRQGLGLEHPSLRPPRDLESLASGKAVRDERRLERDDGLARLERSLHLRRDGDHGIAPTRDTHRAAASSASSTPPTRKPAASASPAPVVSTTSTAGAS